MLEVAALRDHDQVGLIRLNDPSTMGLVGEIRREFGNPAIGQQVALAQSCLLDGNPKRFHGWLLFVQVVSHWLQFATALNSDCHVP